MCRANPTWGAPRIHGELLKLGIEIAETTVGQYLVRPRRPPSQTWRTFLPNHVGQLVAVDFFVVPTLTWRVLFVFVVLAHERRRILHVNVTEHRAISTDILDFRARVLAIEEVLAPSAVGGVNVSPCKKGPYATFGTEHRSLALFLP